MDTRGVSWEVWTKMDTSMDTMEGRLEVCMNMDTRDERVEVWKEMDSMVEQGL